MYTSILFPVLSCSMSITMSKLLFQSQIVLSIKMYLWIHGSCKVLGYRLKYNITRVLICKPDEKDPWMGQVSLNLIKIGVYGQLNVQLNEIVPMRHRCWKCRSRAHRKAHPLRFNLDHFTQCLNKHCASHRLFSTAWIRVSGLCQLQGLQAIRSRQGLRSPMRTEVELLSVTLLFRLVK